MCGMLPNIGHGIGPGGRCLGLVKSKGLKYCIMMRINMGNMRAASRVEFPSVSGK